MVTTYSPPPVLTIPPQSETLVFVVSPEGIDATVKNSIPGVLSLPFGLTNVTARMDIDTAPTGANLIVDMNYNGTTAMVNKFTIEATETSTTTATTQPSLISTSISQGTKITFDIDQIGATVKGRFIQVILQGIRN